MSVAAGKAGGRSAGVTAARAVPVPLPVSRIALYGLPALPMAALALPLYVVVPTFYAEQVGLSLALVGTILLVIRLADAALDPLIGWWADRLVVHLGRRRGLFALSLPLTALSVLMLFAPPEGAGVGWLALWGLLASVGFTLTSLPHAAWGAELATDYHGRARLSAIREGFTLAGTLVAIVLPFAVGLGAPGSWHGLAVLGIVVAVLLPLSGLVAIVAVPEPVDHSRTRLGLVASVGLLAANRPFLRLAASFLLNGFANAVPASLFLPFVAGRLGLADWQGPLLLAYFASAIAGVPLALVVSRRLGKHRAWCWGMLAACAIFAGALFLGRGDGIAFLVICVATGVLLGFDLALPPAIQADVIDADTARSGQQMSGVYFAAWALVTKLASALAVGLVFPALAWGGYQTGSDTQTGTALLTLGLLYAGLPIIPKLLAIALMWNFPIDEAAQAETRRLIEEGSAGQPSSGQ